MIRVLSISNNVQLQKTIGEICGILKGFKNLDGIEGCGGCIRDVLNTEKADVIILDLDFEACDIAQNFFWNKVNHRNVQFIGITCEFEKAYYGLKRGFVDVCLKPIDSESIIDALIKCQNIINNTNRVISIGSSKESHFLKVSEILYIKADDNNVDFHLSDRNVIPFFNSLKHFEKQLSIPFIRIQKSYIINAALVCKINRTKHYIMMRNCNDRIPFSSKYTGNISLIEGLIKNGPR